MNTQPIFEAARERATRGLRLLRTCSQAQRIAQISDACARLRQRACHDEDWLRLLADESRLSIPMVKWGLHQTLAVAQHGDFARVCAQFTRLSEGTIPVLPRLRCVWLSGNVFVAPLRALLLPILFGIPVVARPSRRSRAFPQAIRDALEESSPGWGDVLTLCDFDPDNDALVRDFFSLGDDAAAYGGDETLARLRRLLPSHGALSRHGHGLGVIVLPLDAWHSADADSLAAAVAEDVAAYDQRGCMSPQALLLELPDASRSGAREHEYTLLHAEVHGAEVQEWEAPDEKVLCFAETLQRHLDRIAHELPRGPLSTEDAAAVMQWEAVASMRGHLMRGKSHSLCIETLPLRPSAAFRTLSIVPFQRGATLNSVLSAFGAQLKVVALPDEARLRARELSGGMSSVGEILSPRRGSGGKNAENAVVFADLRYPCAPRACNVGEMQRPRLSLWSDGQSLCKSFRFVENC